MKKKGTKDEQTIFQITNQTTILQQAWVNDRIKINGQANHFSDQKSNENHPTVIG